MAAAQRARPSEREPLGMALLMQSVRDHGVCVPPEGDPNMNELEALKKLVAVLTNQRNFALDKLAQTEATLIIEREAAAKAETKPQVSAKPPVPPMRIEKKADAC